MAAPSNPGARRSEVARWTGIGAASGALSALTFQQGAVVLLEVLGLSAPLTTTLWSLAVWGAVWGALLAATLARLRGARFVLAATVFGAVVPTMVALAVAASLKGQPPMTGVVPLAALIAALLNGIWGLGTALGLRLFGRASPT